MVARRQFVITTLLGSAPSLIMTFKPNRSAGAEMALASFVLPDFAGPYIETVSSLIL
jgi:hypothetical protein